MIRSRAIAPGKVVTTMVATATMVATGCAHVGDDGRARAEGARAAVELCAGLPPAEIERTLADEPGRVIEARPVREFGGRPHRARALGADLVIRHDADLDARSLEALFACHAARYQAGLAREAAARDPLGVPGVRVRAQTASGRVVLSLRADDERAAAEIARRAAELASSS